MIAAPIIYSLTKDKYSNINYTSQNFKNNKFNLSKLLFSSYLFCFSFSIYLIYSTEVRPFTYFIVITVIATLTLLSIFILDLTSRLNTSLILFQVSTLYINIIWGVNLNYYFFIGRTDPMIHSWLIQQIMQNAYVTDVFDIYRPFPLWHILCSIVYIITEISMSAHKVMFLTNGLLYSILPILVYSISLIIFGDRIVASLSALFIAINPDTILLGMQSYSRSAVILLFAVLILCLFKSIDYKNLFLSITLIFCLILYHTASMPYILLLLVMIFILEKIYPLDSSERPLLSLKFLSLCLIATLGYWMFYAEKLFRTLTLVISRPQPGNVIKSGIISTPINELFNYLHYSPLLFLIILGSLISLRSTKISNRGKIFCILGLLAVTVSFPGPLLVAEKLLGDLNFARFGQYTFLFICLTASLGLKYLFIVLEKWRKLIVIILFMLMALGSISNDFTATDNPLVKRQFYTFYITENEEIAFLRLASVSHGFVMSDFVTYRYLSEASNHTNGHIIEIDRSNLEFLRNESDDIILIRKSELVKRPLGLYSNPDETFSLNPNWFHNLEYYYYENFNVFGRLIKYNKIYDSDDVEAFK